MSYISLQEIGQAITQLDPMGLMGFPIFAPYEEYFSEAKMIAEWLENQDDDVTVDALGNAMWKVCCEMFGQIFPKKDFLISAGNLLGTDDRVRCPVCRKYYFDNTADFGICLICGWENDLLQYEDYSYDGGANELNVNESVLEYFLGNHDKTKHLLRTPYWKFQIKITRKDYVRKLVDIYIRYFLGKTDINPDDKSVDEALMEDYLFEFEKYTFKYIYDGIYSEYDIEQGYTDYEK